MKSTISHRIALPSFTTIDVASIESTLEQMLRANQAQIETLLQRHAHFNWDNLMQPLEEIEDRLSKFWQPIVHLHAVKDSTELRAAYNACLPKLSDYYTALSHNQKLYAAINAISHELVYQQLNQPQRKIVDNALRDFKLSGITLPPEKKQCFSALSKQLTQLTSKFEQNVLDATQAWTKHITDKKELLGLPQRTVATARQAAEQRQQTGWLVTLEMPVYLAVITHAESRALREEIYTAYSTRASDKGPNASQFDNSRIMHDILSARREMARLLDFENFAHYSLATKMVKQPDQVLQFLHQLTITSLPKARQEFAELREFAQRELGITDIKVWDVAFAAEKLRQQRYAISQEELRPYFPAPHVLTGLFALVNRLFNIRVQEMPAVDVWHDDVRCFAVYDSGDELRSYFYFDLYARANKRGGAWMDNAQSRRRLAQGELQRPIAFVTCNFNAPVGEDPALLSHGDVITLLHEFGHALQHMLTKIDYVEVAGINGIPWDAVELASQFLENWAWEKESLALLAKHYETGAALPDDLFAKMRRAKNFHAALAMLKQIEYALFDMRLHIEFDPAVERQIQTILDDVRQAVCVVPQAAFNRFQHAFSHIFAGGYAAGYYSYKWAEVMASDAFALFKEHGIFDRTTADNFLTYILEPGGSEEPAKLFRAFRGREPSVAALLQHSGIVDTLVSDV